MQVVRTAPPPLAGIFRSEAQANLLSVVFLDPEPHTITDLAKLANTNRATASRTVADLQRHGIVDIIDAPGTAKLVVPNAELAWAPELRRILAHTYGLLPQLQRMLAEEPRVEQAWIFGSWARRWHGEPGHFPRDVDIVIVTTAGAFDLLLPWDILQDDLNIEVNPIFRHPDQFSLDDPLWADTPMVKIA